MYLCIRSYFKFNTHVLVSMCILIILGYTYKPNYTCISGSGNQTKVSIKSFDRAVELCNEDSSCRCINDSWNDEVYSLWTGKTSKACSDCTAWVCH